MLDVEYSTRGEYTRNYASLKKNQGKNEEKQIEKSSKTEATYTTMLLHAANNEIVLFYIAEN